MSQRISSSLGMHDQDWPCTADATNELVHHARTAYSLVNGDPNEAFLATAANDYLQHGAGLTSTKDRMGVMQKVGDHQLAHLEKANAKELSLIQVSDYLFEKGVDTDTSMVILKKMLDQKDPMTAASLDALIRTTEPVKVVAKKEEKRREQAMDVEAAPAPAMSLSAAMHYLQENGLETGEALDVIAEIPEDQNVTETYLKELMAADRATAVVPEKKETAANKPTMPAVQDREFFSTEAPMGMGAALHYLESIHHMNATDAIDVLSTLADDVNRELYPQVLDDAVTSWKSGEQGFPVEEIEAPAMMEKHEDKLVAPAPKVMSPKPKSIAKEDVKPAIDQLDLIRDYLVEAGIIHDDAMVSRIEEFARTWSHDRLHDELMRQAGASFTEERGVLEPVSGYQPEDDVAVLYMAYELQDKESLFRKYAEQAGPQKKQSLFHRMRSGLSKMMFGE